MPANLQSTSSANDFEPCTPNDSTTFSPTRGISWSVDGTIEVVTAEGNQRTITTGMLNTKQIHPMSIIKVLSTGTTATGIVLYR